MEQLEIVIESRGGSNHKYDYDSVSGSFMLTKLLPKGMVFPFDFGFIPATIGGDGDPLDVMVIGESPTFTGCKISCRIIGCLLCHQTETDGQKTRNDRYLAIANISEQYAAVRKLSDLPKGLLEKLEAFFINYNDIAGKSFVVYKRVGPSTAMAQIKAAEAKNNVAIRLEMLVPETDSTGKLFPQQYYRVFEKELVNRFGGLTAYHRTPVKGIWQDGKRRTEQAMIIYELLLPKLDIIYWQQLKERLEKKFGQKEILILHGPANKIC